MICSYWTQVKYIYCASSILLKSWRTFFFLGFFFSFFLKMSESFTDIWNDVGYHDLSLDMVCVWNDGIGSRSPTPTWYRVEGVEGKEDMEFSCTQ